MNRISFLSSTTIGGALAATGVPGGTDLVESRASFDMVAFDGALGKSADIRQVWESLSFKPQSLNNVKNSLNGLQFSFGYAPDRIAVAVANHGPSSAFTYSDEIWTKYRIGDFFNIRDVAGVRVATNVYYARKNGAAGPSDPNDEKSPYQDSSIAALQARGVVFLTCHTAVQEQARALVATGHAPAGMAASDVASDLLTHLIPGAFVVPAMVATIAVLQNRFGYTYVTIQS